MTVSTTINKISYTASASQTTFAYTFKIFADADLKVYVNETLKTLTTDYTVTGAGSASGGNVVFGTGLSASDVVVIERILSLTQGTDYVENDAFPADTHEDALDRLTFITQQHQDELDRSVKFATTVTDAGDVEVLGDATARASKLFAFDSSGDLDITQEIGVYKGTDATTTTAAYIQRDIVKSTTTAQLNNVYICTAASSIGTELTNTSYWALIVDAVSAASSATAAASSATAAASSATAASTSATNAASSATAAASSATSANTAKTAAEAAQTAAEAAADNFDDTYLGAKSSDPSVDNDGDALTAGDMYFNTTTDRMKVYDGSSWANVALDSATIVSKTSATGSAELPSGTTGERDGSPATGYLRFNTTDSSFEGYNGSAWGAIGGGATGGGSDAVFVENDQTVTTDYTLGTNKNASSVGPVTINTGKTVTVPTGARWVIL